MVGNVESSRHNLKGQPPDHAGRGYRILMIAPTSFFADYGCHVRILEEARTLERLGNQVTICTYHKGRDLPDLDIRRTFGIPWRGNYEVGSSRHKAAFDMLLFERTFRAMLSSRPDIIHAHLHEGALIGGLLSRLWGVPMVFDFQGSLTGEMIDHKFLSPHGRWHGFMLRLERFIDHMAPAILTSSAHAVDLLIDEFGVPAHRITHMPDCVNTDEFAPVIDTDRRAALRQRWGIPSDRTVIVYLGLLAEYQGTDHLLRAVAGLYSRQKNIHLLIGGYPNVDHYQNMARELGLHDAATFAGRINYEDAPAFLAAGDIAVSPKLSRTEGVGKVLNYMAMGLPTVSYDTDAGREYLGAQGVFARRADAADLARTLEELIQDPTRRAQIGAALRERARTHSSWDTAGRIILNTYDTLTRSRSATALRRNLPHLRSRRTIESR